MKEIWKDIPNYEGLYQVSNLGRVKSLDRTVYGKDGKSYTKRGKILKNKMGTNGYYYVCLYRNNKQKTFMIHSLVALNYIGERPKNHDICHINGNKLDNTVQNLKYDTRTENFNDMYRQGGKNPKGKLSVEDVLKMREMYKTGKYTFDELADLFNMSSTHTSAIIRRKSFTWLNDDGSIKESTTATTFKK